MLNKYLDVREDVLAAIEKGEAVVALESTIISHGMPYPQNVETALQCEKFISEGGAIPATIGIIKGRLIVGLTEEEIEYMGKEEGIVKVSRRDLPFIVARGGDGATTVAATMIIAALAGIKVFATGGIGGVHRNAQETFDISADLQELANTNVAVVCAGAKSILDIALTLEYLETYGVPVVGYQTEEFPAFYTRKSGHAVDYKVESAEELAQAIKAKWDLNLNGGIVVANPIPEADELDSELITQAIDDAVREAEAQGIQGKESTPFLLAKVKDITAGESLTANIELVYNNSRVAAELAVALSRL
ncbi:MAG: pseudouridine-5'-phosphate glycosidase [Eubacteriales bacterium]|nr:pseudouridine-5'-phosphate glycosidase [Eubacteriales bacterium]MDD3612015.1 pseudouridine-5'-phosphate glycosidase [Eubacteriales bacterium]